MVYKPARINFTEAQIKKAVAGKPIRFAAHQLNAGPKVVMLHPANHSNYAKAAMKGKGLTITISPAEVLSTVESDMEGTGFFGDVWKGLKSGYNWVKKNVIDTPIYQQTIKPLVRKAVDAGAAALTGMAPEAAPFIQMAKSQIGEKTGAFGAIPVMRKSRMKGGSFRLN
jgi:hypothetical protein